MFSVRHIINVQHHCIIIAYQSQLVRRPFENFLDTLYMLPTCPTDRYGIIIIVNPVNPRRGFWPNTRVWPMRIGHAAKIFVELISTDNPLFPHVDYIIL